MRTALLLSALVLLPPAVRAAEETPPAPVKPLHGADCLDPSAARTWDYVSGTELLVDAGRRKYRIVLAENCIDLGYGADIRFKGDNIGGRVCGNVGEKVQVNQRSSCHIERIEIIDAETYRAATGGQQGTVSAGKKAG
jgi:hypothetical protein